MVRTRSATIHENRKSQVVKEENKMWKNDATKKRVTKATTKTSTKKTTKKTKKAKKNKNLTKLNGELSVDEYLSSQSNRQEDLQVLLEMMKDVTQMEPKMWSTSMVGFGSYNYRYDSGRTGTWFRLGFSNRKQSLTLYLMGCDLSQGGEFLRRLGKYKNGKGCLYINKLADVDIDVLRELVEYSFQLKLKHEVVD